MRYKPDHGGVAKLLVDGDMRRAIGVVGLAALGHAVAIAPRETGDYSKSFVVDVDIDNGRATATLANTDANAATIEWGRKPTDTNRGMAGHYTLTRTADWLENG